MRELEFIVAKEWDNKNAENFLKNKCGISSRLLTKLKRTELGITANGNLLKTNVVVHEGDLIKLKLPILQSECEPAEIPIKIVFEDQDILVVNKPPFQPVHQSHGHQNDTLANAVAAYLGKNRDAFRAINRLDRDTSGLVVCAKNQYSASLLSGKIEKEYTAICQGIIENDFTINAAIRRKNESIILREVHENGDRAVTHIFVKKRLFNHTLINVRLETGRTHQIRVHVSNVGNPLAGDDMYGGSVLHINRQALHCGKIWFEHPIKKTTITLEAALPLDMQQLLNFVDLTNL